MVRYSDVELVDNACIANLAKGIAGAAKWFGLSLAMKKPLFLMVVQSDEDNVYDQHLLEVAIQKEGVRTIRRTFRQLYEQLSTGDNQRLLIEGLGGIDAIYLRAGYQHEDYCAHDLDSEILGAECCATLSHVRVMMEQHRVAINATISQQFATSKRIQMLLSSMPVEALTHFGITLEEAQLVKPFLGEMKPVTAEVVDQFEQENAAHWVLKNQGEGGGHCV